MVKATAASAERNLREENHKANTAARADYEAKILNLNVAHQSESASGNAEIARLTEHAATLAINSENNQRTYHSASAEQQA
eukprot:11027028-Heterocapsa_arctica.AAC.1